LHLPVSVLAILYSASFNLFYLAVAFFLVKTRNYSLGLLMAFYFTLFVSDTYFWTNNEVHQGIAWMFIFFGTILYLGKIKVSPGWSLLFGIPLAFLAIFTHPLVLFPAVFLWSFLILEKKLSAYSNWLLILLSVILLGICIAKLMTSMHSSQYDSYKLQVASDLSFSRIIHALSSPLAKEIIKRSILDYWFIPLLMITGIVSGLRLRKYKVIFLSLSFCFVYFLAICLTYPDFTPFYMESELMPLSIIATAPFVYFTIPQLKSRTSGFLLTGIFLTCILHIAFSSEKFTARKNYIFTTLQFMRETGVKKGIVYENNENREILIMNWGVPTESIIASALKEDKPTLNFIVGSPENISQRMPASNRELISSFENWSYEKLNTRYFSFDTTSSYQIIPGRGE
jgi:hypothetical protein